MESSDFPYASIWQYLEEEGILEHGTDEQIKATKKEYYRLYNRHYLKLYRKQKAQVAIQFTRDEYERLRLLAESTELTVQQLLKRLIAENKEVFVTNPAVTELRQAINIIQSDIKNLLRNFPIGSASKERYERIESRLKKTESLLSDLQRKDDH